MAEQKINHEYDGSQIQVLEGLEAVRKRPGMYIGSTGPRGLHHLVYEIVDNGVDEALAGYCDHIEVTILPDNIIKVSDNGRGIPVDIQPKLGIPAVTVVYTILHAGGKFGGDNSGYKVSGGLHGVGASVVNALSEWLEVEVHRDGHAYYQRFERGVPVAPLEDKGPVEGGTGTIVAFKPDPEMFEVLEYDYETLNRRLREEAFLNAGVRITLTDDRPGHEDADGKPTRESMCYEGGIRSFVEYINQQNQLEVLHPEVIYLKGQAGDALAEVALQYNDSFNERVHSFANNVETPDGGTHEEGFKMALTRVFNDFGREKGYIKEKDDNLSGSDVREGVTAVISVKLTEAQFEGQTKAKLGNTEVRTLVSGLVYDKLKEFFEENPAVAKAIYEKAMQAQRAREAAKKARELVRRKSALETNRMPGKLADCREKDPSKPQGIHHGRCGRGRQPYLHAAAHLFLPFYAAADRARPRVYRPAAAVQAAEGQTSEIRLQRAGNDAAQHRDGPGHQGKPLQGPGRDEPRAAVGDHHGPGQPRDRADHHRGRHEGRRDIQYPHG